jgi:hypothetical protein
MVLTDLVRKALGVLRPVHPHASLSFSQEGEDLVLARMFGHRPDGFYVDVGAHHPTRFSNTYHFYLRGWCGINIDPRTGFAEAFARARPRDINLNWAIGSPPGERTYYEFNEPALNTFDPDRAAALDGTNGYRITNQRTVTMRPMGTVLREHLPPGRRITFLTVDVEGLDLPVLRSNDWDLYRPEAIVAELPDGVALTDLAAEPVTEYLRTHGYRPVSKLVKSAVYALTDDRPVPDSDGRTVRPAAPEPIRPH